ncbi:MAG: hypothetical protein LBQ79_01395 [Deltaproteobacteria bacterium]|nr:hypothetical protein [Deltaproteobacteria bacterium]
MCARRAAAMMASADLLASMDMWRGAPAGDAASGRQVSPESAGVGGASR